MPTLVENSGGGDMRCSLDEIGDDLPSAVGELYLSTGARRQWQGCSGARCLGNGLGQ